MTLPSEIGFDAAGEAVVLHNDLGRNLAVEPGKLAYAIAQGPQIAGTFSYFGRGGYPEPGYWASTSNR